MLDGALIGLPSLRNQSARKSKAVPAHTEAAMRVRAFTFHAGSSQPNSAFSSRKLMPGVEVHLLTDRNEAPKLCRHCRGRALPL